MPAEVGFSQAGEATQPSPSIWGDCPNNLLNDLGLGQFIDVRFDEGSPLGTVATTVVRPSPGPGLSLDCDDDTVLARTSDGKGLSIETDGDDNDAAAVFSAPLGAITRHSGKKFWFEAIVAPGDVDDDMATYVGLVENAGLSRDVIADDVAADGVIGESLIGYIQDLGDPDAYDLLYRKDAGTVVSVATDVTNSTQIASADRASLTDGTFVKLGIRFDGRQTLHFYVNGVKIATQDVDSTVDQTKEYGVIVAIKTGDAAAEQIHLKRIRAGYQERS